MFSTMEEGVNVEQHRSLSASDFINATYELGTNNIKNRASCIWNKSKKHDTWQVSTWSKHMQHSMTSKHGTEDDKRNLSTKKAQ